MEELMSEMNDISDVMGRSYGLGEDVDEAELDAELAMFEVKRGTLTLFFFYLRALCRNSEQILSVVQYKVSIQRPCTSHLLSLSLYICSSNPAG